VQLFGFCAGFRDENHDNVVRRNYIHDQGWSIYWHSPNIQIFGSGSNVVEENFLAMSAYNHISITGVPWNDLNNWKSVSGGRHTMITDNTAAFAVDFSTYPSNVLAEVKAGKPYFTKENYRDLAIHSRNNILRRNIAVECCTRLEEGGSLYSWCPGKGNQWIENIVYQSRSLPGSSIIALDNASEYFTVTSNIVWAVGRAGCGPIGVRPVEKGNKFDGNVNVFGATGWHCTGEPSRASFDRLYNSIKAEVDKAGGWPGNPDINEWIEKLKGQKRFDLTPAQIKQMNKVM